MCSMCTPRVTWHLLIERRGRRETGVGRRERNASPGVDTSTPNPHTFPHTLRYRNIDGEAVAMDQVTLERQDSCASRQAAVPFRKASRKLNAGSM